MHEFHTGKSPEEFFKEKERRGTAITFDDVALLPGYAETGQEAIDLTGRVSRNVPLLNPFAAAAMDTVVGLKMAIACPKNGGIASIPRTFSPQDQADMVGSVKHHIHGFIHSPKTASPDETIQELLARRFAKGWEFHGFPVVDPKTEKLVGTITPTDYKYCDDPQTKVGAIMTPLADLTVASRGITEEEAYDVLKHAKKSLLPVMHADGKLAGIYTWADLRRRKAARERNETTAYNVDKHGRLRTMTAIGAGDGALQRAELLIPRQVDVLHIDMANGAQAFVLQTVRDLHKKFGSYRPDVIVGNFATPQSLLKFLSALRDEGLWVDGILVGIGGGSICTTGVVTGVRVPQLTAVYWCAQIAKQFGIPVVSDGGIRYSGDIAKALAVGAQSVMIGNMLAGTDEAPGEIIELPGGRRVKLYYGMGSIEAFKKSDEARKRYIQSQGEFVPEGIKGNVPAIGPIAQKISVEFGGVRKGFHTCGARSIRHMQEVARLYEITSAGWKETLPHNVQDVAATTNFVA